jgi:hypothetical protein
MGMLFIAYFIFGRSKQKPPTKLNLRAPATIDPQLDELRAQMRAPNAQQPQIEGARQSVLEPEAATQPPIMKRSKQLSIFFMYNGHDWEAHEVLGIPQGAGVDIATKAYQDQLKTADPSSFEFLESAYSAIFAKRRNEKL